MRRPALPVALLALPWLACSETDPTAPGPTPAAVFSTAPVVDGSLGGNPHFFFLPPLIGGNPNADGEFNPDLLPVVEICQLAFDACADPQPDGFPIRYASTGPGRPLIRVNPSAEFYQVPFRTSDYQLDPVLDYRIRVFAVAGGQELGHLDLDIVGPGGEFRSNRDLLRVRQGQTLPIRFRIEHGITCTFGIDCIEAVVGAGGTTITTPSDFAGVVIPPGAVDGPILITVERVDVSATPCLPSLIPQAEGCYRFDTDPALSEVQESGLDEFNVDVVVGVCLDPAVLSLPEHHEYALHKFDPEQPELGVVQLPTAFVDFLDCGGFTALAFRDDGRVMKLARAGWQRLAPLARMLGPGRAHAVNLGFGGLAKSFSNIGWARGLELTLLAGAGQVGSAGSTLPVAPAVRVNATHWDPDDFESAPIVEGVVVTFRFTDPAGAETVLTDVTDAAGVASVPWVLGAATGTNTLRIEGATIDDITVTAQGTGVIGIARVDEGPDESGIPTFPTVAEAYTSVGPGGTILVAEGVHSVSGMVIDAPITIVAETPGEAIIEGSATAPAAAFVVDGVSEGDVIFRGLTFSTGSAGIWARGTYDRVVVEDSHFLTTVGISAEASSHAGASLLVQGSTFTGGSIGVVASGVRLEVRNSVFESQRVFGIALTSGTGVLEGNEVTGNAESGFLATGIAVVRARANVTGNTVTGAATGIRFDRATGRVGGNEMEGCRATCISVIGPGRGQVTVADNVITIASGDGTGAAISVVSGTGRPWLTVTDNTITGLTAPGDPANPLDYSFDAGIVVASTSGGAGAPVELSRNRIVNARRAIDARLGAVVHGRDNVITTAYQGLTSADNAQLDIHFSDIVGAFIGLAGNSGFGTTCNYWGSAAGPANVASIPRSSYAPWFVVPTAGVSETSCEPIDLVRAPG